MEAAVNRLAQKANPCFQRTDGTSLARLLLLPIFGLARSKQTGKMKGKQQLLGSVGSLCSADYYKYYIRNISETTHNSSWPRTFKPRA